MKVLLTSCGLETEGIKNYFAESIKNDMRNVRALFIPTAAVDADSVAMLPKCMNDLLKCGIPSKNITVFDLHEKLPFSHIRQYDVIYLCGGNEEYLLKRINDTGFDEDLMQYINDDGFVIGVSAGSLIFAANLPDNLGLIDVCLDVHCTEGDPQGAVEFPLKKRIRLTDSSALAINSIPAGLKII